jgi:hypothetical protein
VIEVVIFAEGQTEEGFIKRVVAASFQTQQVFLKPQTLRTSREASGGGVTFDRLKFHARNVLRQKPQALLSTFLDLYALDTSFPGFKEAKRKKLVEDQVACLESALHAAIVAHVGCQPDRFLPHIQPHEFEGLLFSDVDSLATVEPGWRDSAPKLHKIRAAYETPEHINDGVETKPSSRLDDVLRPRYRKTLHGPLAAQRITLDVIERECPHFRGWLENLRRLTPSG